MLIYHEKHLAYINTNVEYGRNFKTTLKIIGFSIKSIYQKLNIFVGVLAIDYEKILKNLTILFYCLVASYTNI